MLNEADLRGTDLEGAILQGTKLRACNLRSANLADADLAEADLSFADIRGAVFREANLNETDLTDVIRNRTTTLAGANINSPVCDDDLQSELCDGAAWQNSAANRMLTLFFAGMAGVIGMAPGWLVGKALADQDPYVPIICQLAGFLLFAGLTMQKLLRQSNR